MVGATLISVGASLLAKAMAQIQRGMHKRTQVGYQAASRAFDFGRPVKPRWPEFDIEACGKPAGMPV